MYFLIYIKVRSAVGKSLDLHQVDSNFRVFDICVDIAFAERGWVRPTLHIAPYTADSVAPPWFVCWVCRGSGSTATI